ncbi:tryptophanyl-tRNA synthetase [Actinomadura meyerae]|jgi:tryptophanyl-tRNA synthetase|uniref:Tryptophan--tRNA ligase n=1 Tax=Actinomadura meyerae TaxID=240840 RepID=A0A239D0E1_9ACTN|nr:tryptophan--tRNA ligase [Actinomadura meyerae]SNS25787.1 tryptophanyl-tRNA synthetase [Actinomadura meyerae]
MPEAPNPEASDAGTAAAQPRVLSGIQPTADSFHLGNYLGALRQWVAMQDTHEAFYCVVDLHAITVEHDPALLRRRTKVAAAQLLAMGIDPDRSAVFVQSHVPEHAELAWVLSCLTGFGEASRMTQFKDKSAKQGTSGTSVGLFTYPILQAADILLYTPEPDAGRALRVPVGEDQRQHLELTRTLAQRFNHRFGETFVLPDAHIPEGAAKITDLQEPGAKMSKSASSPQGIIDVLEEPGPMRKKIMRAVTDTGSEVVYDEEKKAGVTNLLRIYSALEGTSVPDLEARYAGSGYGQFKKDLAQVVLDTFTPIRERTLKLLDDEEHLDRLLARGAERASAVAVRTMETVRERVGFVGRGR